MTNSIEKVFEFLKIRLGFSLKRWNINEIMNTEVFIKEKYHIIKKIIIN